MRTPLCSGTPLAREAAADVCLTCVFRCHMFRDLQVLKKAKKPKSSHVREHSHGFGDLRTMEALQQHTRFDRLGYLSGPASKFAAPNKSLFAIKTVSSLIGHSAEGVLAGWCPNIPNPPSKPYLKVRAYTRHNAGGVWTRTRPFTYTQTLYGTAIYADQLGWFWGSM